MGPGGVREGTIPLTNIRGGFLFVSLIGDPALFRMRPMFNIALRKKKEPPAFASGSQNSTP